MVALLVVGAGPYGVAVAAQAIERGIDTVVVGHPMGFWTDHMPEGMFLRSGTDWHLDASGIDTFEAFIEDRGLSSAHIDPVPIDVFLEYAAWFQIPKTRVRPRSARLTPRRATTTHSSPRSTTGPRLQPTSSSPLRARPTSASSPSGRRCSPKASVRTPVISFAFRSWPGRGSWSLAVGRAPTNGPHSWANTVSGGSTLFTGTTSPASSE